MRPSFPLLVSSSRFSAFSLRVHYPRPPHRRNSGVRGRASGLKSQLPSVSMPVTPPPRANSVKVVTICEIPIARQVENRGGKTGRSED